MTTNINNIINLKTGKQLSASKSSPWLDIINVRKNHSLSKKYQELCQQHHLNNKWILMVNPESNSLEKLAATEVIDTSKILKVNINKSKVALKNIESALCKGNCSAVILCNPSLKNEEISQLTLCAQQGKTACIVLKDNRKLH